MLPSQFLLSASAFLAALTVASPNPRLEIIVTVQDSSAVNDAPRIAPQEDHFIDWYDCSTKIDGNYPDPCDCHKFIACSGGYASERDCAPCIVDPYKCPSGSTVYDESYDACLEEDVVKCNPPDDRFDCGGENLLTKQHEQQVVLDRKSH